MTVSTSSTQTPVELMKQFYKIADERPFVPEKLEAFIADSVIDHDPLTAAPADSPQAIAHTYAMLASGAPDSKHILEFVEPVGENKALVRWRYVGTHTGEMFGFPASGNKVDIAGIEIWGFTGEKISEFWHVEEIAKFFEQLGKG